jgi:PadR family transcriptional regulator, regulatory protein AphA
MSARTPTTAQYACLVLLGDRTLTATQIIEGMRRSGIRYVWPRADSRLYETPRQLCELGWAEVAGDRSQGRGTRYRVTDEGRAALGVWLDEPGRPPSFEYEALLKLYSSVHGTREQTLAQLEVMRNHVVRSYAVLMQISARLATSGMEQPGVSRMSALLFEYSRYELDMRARWLAHATEVIDGWPEGAPTEAEVASIQAWFLERSKDVADALGRFRAPAVEVEVA